MRIEIGAQKPENFIEGWEGQYSLFSHFEFACGIPHLLFAVTTLKENGKPNVCFNSWSSFTGSGDGFFAVMSGIGKYGHTYKNIKRTGEFVINFLGKDYYDTCIATINNNADDADEFVSGGFTIEPARTLSCPRIKEAFLCLECRFVREVDLTGSGSVVLLIGRVSHAAMSEAYAGSIDGKYEDNGFMFNIHTPKNLKTGEGNASAVAVCKIVRVNEEG